MNEIITLDILAARVAEMAGITPEQGRQYINLIKEIATRQLTGPSHSVTIPHVGTFTVTNLDNATVTYTPEQVIAETVNEPFSFFEPVPLCDDSILETPLSSTETINESVEPAVTISDTTGTSTDTTEDEDSATEHDRPSDIETVQAETVQAETDISAETAPEQEPDYEPDHNQETTTGQDSQPADPQPEAPIRTVYITDEATSVIPQDPAEESPSQITTINEPEPTSTLQQYTPMEYDDQQPRGMSPIVAYILGILTGMILTCIAVFFLYPPLHSDDDIYDPVELEDNSTSTDELTEILTGSENTITETPVSDQAPDAKQESPQVQTQVPSESNTPASNAKPASTPDSNREKATGTPKTDTVGRNYYLATMSRKYYGRMEFWVYIYKENQSKLGHPDRIPVGTVVTIPPASKYDINPDSQASIDQARRIAAEIKDQYK